jgi:hypothetical protein
MTELIKLDGFDDAIMGIVERNGLQCICYDKTKIIEILMVQHGMDHDEAIEYFDFNIVCAYVGEFTPFIFTKMNLHDINNL